MPPTKQSIVFFHPDLGIGGAERLVIDAAVGLQNLGHKVTIFTSHCDPSHCFEEARDGTLDVRVRGNSVIPSTILGRFWILCAILRQLHLILQIALFYSELRELEPTAFFVDQLSAGIPILCSLQPQTPVIFYCHFPDKLLAKKGGLLKNIYRLPFDTLESWSTGCSDSVVVNSKFTRSIFAEAFPGLRHRQPGVVYPCVDTEAEALTKRRSDVSIDTTEAPWNGKRFVLSINRYEQKKDVALAVKAYAGLSDADKASTRLVVAGGYDPRNAENLQTYSQLRELADSLSLKNATAKTVVSALAVPNDIQVLFLHSVPGAFKDTLLKHTRLLVYTPLHEHFGIVPLEAMLAKTPVLAANEGGPTETVLEGETGWLRNVKKVDEWTAVMQTALATDTSSAEQLRAMGRKGHDRVKAEFSKTKMAHRLDTEIRDMVSKPRIHDAALAPVFVIGAIAVPMIAVVVASALLWARFFLMKGDVLEKDI